MIQWFHPLLKIVDDAKVFLKVLKRLKLLLSLAVIKQYILNKERTSGKNSARH